MKKMFLKDKIESYLEEEPRARERAFKNRAIVNLLRRDYPVLADIDKEVLIQIVKDYSGYDRAWRAILEQREDLRGADYDEKLKLIQEKQIELGYEENFYENKKKLKLL